MKIEVAKLGRMSQTGSSLITLYQDKHTPILDLLIRESVQNCLDAGNTTNPQAEQKNYVEVSFLTGDFCPSDLNAILEGSTQSLNKRYPGSKARYLAVKDKYTSGLTGPLNIASVDNYHYGNLLKLVYDICKPQEGAGAGGSWGIGKTIFFRVGIGLVVYYSRIWDDQTNQFSSRFAVSLVEDEHDANCIIPKSTGICNSGIAWWGELVGDNETEPVTNEKEIEEYLQIFGIEPFKGKETGTVVVVPYINEDALLSNNRADEYDGIDNSKVIPTWFHSIDEYISVAVQRWYFPRLNNSSYKYGKHLRLFVNDKRIKKGDMAPLFRIWQALYDSAVTGTALDTSDFDHPFEINVEKIRLNKYLIDTCAGNVAYTIVGRDSLGMCPPDNLYSPFTYLDLDEYEGDSNKPLFAFCRMPGMVVDYKANELSWVKGVPYTDGDKYLVAIFALNSNNTLVDYNIKLEEYVRKSEMADHHAWDDYNLSTGKRPDIISRMKTHTANKLAKVFVSEDNNGEEKTDSGWSHIATNLLLPKEGFGTKSNRKPKVESRLEYQKHKNVSIALSEEDTAYFGSTMEFTYYVQSLKKCDDLNLNLYIDSEAKAINPKEWEGNGLELPFSIQSIFVRIDKLNGVGKTIAYRIEKNDGPVFDTLISLAFNQTDSSNAYGLHMQFNDPSMFTVAVTFSISINTKNFKPVVKAE